jgi:hypothetical protein
VPEEALIDERVDPTKQSEPTFAGLIRRAMRENWAATPEEKDKAIRTLIEIMDDPDAENREKIASVRALMHADFRQWEHDHPELAGKTRGGVQVNNRQTAITGDEAVRLLQEIEKQTGQPIMSEAMLEIEEDASRVLPEEMSPQS